MVADKVYVLQMPQLDNDEIAGDYLAPKDSLNG